MDTKKKSPKSKKPVEKPGPSLLKRATWIAEACIFFLISAPVAILPSRQAVSSGKIVGFCLYHLFHGRRRIAVENIRGALPALRRANPELDGISAEEIAHRSFSNLGASLVENVKIYFGLGKRIFETIEFQGVEHYQEACSEGKGVFLITGHCGNWELMALAIATRYSGMAAVARRQNNPILNNFFEKMRSRYGNRLIYKEGAFRRILAEMRENGVVGILLDQAVIPSEGYIVNFLGRKAWALKTPAMMARKTGSPIIPVFMHRTTHGHVIAFQPRVVLSAEEGEAAALADTAALSRCVESYVEQHPFEWLWIHRRWKRAGQPAED